GNGFPIGACLAGGRAANLFMPGTHGSTFGGNPLACRVGCTVVDIMERDEIPKRTAYAGTRFLRKLELTFANILHVVSVRGHGLMAGIEMDCACNELVERALLDERLLISVTRDKTIRLLPPLICSD